MYTVDSLENAIRDLYCSGISSAGYERASVESMLDSLDFCTLLQAVRHSAETVHTYTTQGRAPKSFNYRSGELFPQRATLLYEDFDQGNQSGEILVERHYELWLLEDMSLVVVSCVSVDFGDGEFVTEYREIKQGDPWNTPMCLNLEELAENLFEMFGQCYEHTLPIYEL